ncbi:enoyl-CoA hydratase/isomerase family protein [Stappia sp. ES.058]|uniref:enoyl-CoA hydratase/isomerase family protein n=1 Tax=Stappia sp. ES.058 TaxID=1881061 RepID=UPI00087CEA6C|nr:enoyl-CoA hydratase/isomerase family protein [Stappia sp. ES.058]SDU03359.1 enoyl-CoA hydratase [Stappia sp. ES.058]
MTDHIRDGAGTGDVLIRRQGRAGRITLTRPRSLNLLTRAMVQAIHAALDRWRDDPAIELLIIDAEGRAFCAGGDIRQVHAHVIAGDLAAARDHIRDEYRLDLKLARYPKPVVTLMNGAVMGGGIGLGCHASHPVAGDRFRLSLPECSIGWIPDSGSTSLLARLPPGIGALMAVAGLQIDAADALDLGFIDYTLDSSRCPELIDTLCATGDPAVLGMLSTPMGDPALRKQVARLRLPDAMDSPAALAQALQRTAEDPDMARWCTSQLKALARGAPLTQALALRALDVQRRRPGLARALALELRIVSALLTHPDFREGVRAMMVDRDKRPVWTAPTGTVFSRSEINTFLQQRRDRDVIRKFTEDPAK